jgi:hypothetical protein
MAAMSYKLLVAPWRRHFACRVETRLDPCLRERRDESRRGSLRGCATIELLPLALLFLALSAAAANVPRRIVSLAPNITELLYGVGAFPQVVGVSDYCTYPPEAGKLPTVGESQPGKAGGARSGPGHRG